MNRRRVIQAVIFSVPALRAVFASEPKELSVRGKLAKGPGGAPELEIADHQIVLLHGDDPTISVLNDARLAGTDFEAIGSLAGPGKFEIDPIHERAMFVHKGGKRLMITYWCDVCYIRTYTPGPCVCCQKYTDLDLRESIDN